MIRREIGAWLAAGTRRCSAAADHPAVYVALLLVVLLLLMPPTGMLSDNEENYFALAARVVSKAAISPDTAVFDASRHRVVNEILLGALVRATGFEAAQIISRLLAALCHALLLRAVFRVFSLAALDAVLVVTVFALLGQSLVGGEWLFNGYEAKVAAYGFVLAALYLALTRRRLVGGTLLLVLATYFHFLVGGFWFVAIMALRLVEERRDLRRVMGAVVAYVLACSPLVAEIAWTRLGVVPTGIAGPGVPPPDVIYALIRAPHHMAPFLNWDYFASLWLRGYLLAGAMLAACLAIARTAGDGRLRKLAVWLALLLAYLFLALALSFLDRHEGVLGKLYLFRPSSLILLLWLALAIAYLNGLHARHFAAVKMLTLAMVVPSLGLGASSQILREARFHAVYDGEKKSMADALARVSTPDSVVLVDPRLESAFIDFERLTGRPSLVMWKFDPTNDREIVEWYRRMEFRKAVFEEGCPPSPAYRVDFLLTPVEDADEVSKTCGPVIHATSHMALIRRAR